jgi:hypothetical protein
VGPRASLNAVAKKKNASPCLESNSYCQPKVCKDTALCETGALRMYVRSPKLFNGLR